MAELAARLDDIDAEILRLHQHSVNPDTQELAALLDLCQIDELLEKRYRLAVGATTDTTSR
jgi:hypothetical protein